jgi:uncharacterized protein
MPRVSPQHRASGGEDGKVSGRTGLLILGAAGALYLALLALLFVVQRTLIYPSPARATIAPLPGFDMPTLNTDDGLALRSAYRAPVAGRETIVFFHGNGDSLAGAETATRHIAAAGYGVLLVEYRGYAGHPGKPSEDGLYKDGRAALAWLARRGTPPDKVVLVGNSLGSGVATQLATEQRVAGLVLISGFTALPDVAARHYRWLPVALLLRDRYANRDKMSRVSAPVLLLHGEADTLIPPRHSVVLAGAAHKATLALVPHAGHELAYGDRAQAILLGWLARKAGARFDPAGRAPPSAAILLSR